MKTYTYDLETLALADLRDGNPEGAASERVIACDHAGTCRVEEVVEDIRFALTARLNERGRDGWRLAHMDVHAEVVLLVWEKPEDAA
jgi:hypothetical protein